MIFRVRLIQLQEQQNKEPNGEQLKADLQKAVNDYYLNSSFGDEVQAELRAAMENREEREIDFDIL